MSTEKRTSTQETFMASKDQIVVATIAFGMGIDKADIRNIVHFAIPKSIEGYSQEIGRAGRDGLPSTCIAYLCHDDIRIMEEWSRADIPSFRSINGLVGEILEMYKFSKTGDVIERHLNDESREWDIRLAALGLLNAQLELRFSLIRAITPKYSNYKYTRSSGFEAKTADSSKVTSTLKKTSKTTKKWTQIDVDVAAFTGGFPREDAVRKLQQWHDSGAIELSPSGVVNRFRIVNPFPKTQAEKDDIIEGIYEQIKARERSDMERVQQVIDLLTASECISTKLARHFGDDILVESGKCEHCNWCITGKAVEYSRGQMVTKDAINEDKIKAILKATSVRDDANFLARVAFGISSPRVTIEKLGKHEVFGSLSGCDFEVSICFFPTAMPPSCCFGATF
ncbi:uncharacterized protein KY384_002961 [Bacidia gigantensis]|uniref:uncharacterized protein n=1 Tax=Bacidia gigantensis TaxID=2732470 RepID=UPI001D043BAA|nr:uncharacterized protein KY384_002961 [Bacidia gigantensis]KAG8531332.1 hypothetical protein KY384_002961 [Bacidia gigantensis]